ncbi:MAG TPA: molecular chaperone DnaJ [Candidatus Polarisedimenticolaceae bacterium]|nr:molecular chaperone DnaJ [Candidatus Polarisedimenticolaceae bacterium]
MPTRAKKDYYEILGVGRDADEKAIKAAYRRLARKYHPDLNKGDKRSEERFKEVAEAFAVLSDTEKRARYDRGGHEAFGAGFDPFSGFDARQFDFGFGSGGIEELLGQLFGGRFGGTHARTTPRAARGQDLRFETRIAFLDAVRGATIDLVVPRQVRCQTCAGSGLRPGQSESTCPACSGSGRQEREQRGMRVSVGCTTCGGRGRLPGAPCDSCGGRGRVPSEERVKVRIPPGVADGDTLRIAGKGDAGTSGAPPGDLLLRIDVDEDARFRREGHDLICDVPVGISRAALGGEVDVPTLNGPATIKLPQGTRSGQRFRLRGKGVPASGGRPAGDLFAVIQIHPPRKLEGRSRELIEEFDRLNPDGPR